MEFPNTHLKYVFIKTTYLKIKKTAAKMVSSKIQAYSTAAKILCHVLTSYSIISEIAF